MVLPVWPCVSVCEQEFFLAWVSSSTHYSHLNPRYMAPICNLMHTDRERARLDCSLPYKTEIFHRWRNSFLVLLASSKNILTGKSNQSMVSTIQTSGCGLAKYNRNFSGLFSMPVVRQKFSQKWFTLQCNLQYSAQFVMLHFFFFCPYFEKRSIRNVVNYSRTR